MVHARAQRWRRRFGSTGWAGLDQCFWIGISVGVTKHHDQKKVEKEKVYFIAYKRSSLREARAEVCSQELMQSSWRGVLYGLTLACFDIPQDLLATGGSTRSGLGLLTSIFNQENTLQFCLQTS